MPSSTGAPTHVQSSRKGKKAWRKGTQGHEDVIEAGLEASRAHERVFGKGGLGGRKDDELFVVDIVGDEEVAFYSSNLNYYNFLELDSVLTTSPLSFNDRPRSPPPTPASRPSKPPKKLLKAQQILSERSAHAPVFSRSQPSVKAYKPKSLTWEEKGRLLRIAGKQSKDSMGFTDVRFWGEGGAAGVMSKGGKLHEYDAWKDGEEDDSEEMDVDGGDGFEVPKKKKVKTPRSLLSVSSSSLSNFTLPTAGQSYNPPLQAHQAALSEAYEIELARVTQFERDQAIKQSMEKARKANDPASWSGGMAVFDPDAAVSDEEEDQEEEEGTKKKVPRRKTPAEKRKALARSQALQARLQASNNAAHLAKINHLKSLKRQITAESTQREKEVLRRKEKREERMKSLGFEGKKIGKLVVGDAGRRDVQLGEELSESLRGMKTEGNLWRDRSEMWAITGKVEPRKAIIGKKRSNTFKSYEKHAWKRFI